MRAPDASGPSDAGRLALAPLRAAFHALAVAILPEAARFCGAGWQEFDEIVDGALTPRPRSVQRQLRLLIRALDWLPLLRFGRPFTALDGPRRARVLSAVQDSPLTLVRRGFWGLRALVFVGYYGRAAAAAEIGYRADPRGWEARR